MNYEYAVYFTKKIIQKYKILSSLNKSMFNIEIYVLPFVKLLNISIYLMFSKAKWRNYNSYYIGIT